MNYKNSAAASRHLFLQIAVPLLLILSLVGHSAPARAGDTCTVPGWSGPVRCLPIHTNQYVYQDASGAVPGGTPLAGDYISISDFTAALTAKWLASGLCYAAVESITGPRDTAYWLNIPYRSYFDYRIRAGTKDSHGNCNTYIAANPVIQKIRTPDCPTGFSSVSVGGQAMCACPPNTICVIPECPSGLCKGNPVDVMPGLKRQHETDFRSAGLQFVRSFNSGLKTLLKVGNRNSPIGIGWTASYLQHIDYTAEGGVSGAYAFRPDGNVLTFTESASVFTISGGAPDRLEWITSGGVNTGFKLTTADDSVETYSLTGALQSITRRNGVVETLAYDSVGYLLSVTNSFGSVLQFQWTTNAPPKRISKVILPDATQVSFAYDANFNLTSATYPDTKQRIYLYELPETARLNLLTGITDEAGIRFATWGYDSTGRPTSSEHAGGVEHYGITYLANGNRTVVDPLTTSRTYTSTIAAWLPRYSATSLGCNGCGESKAATYDSNGNFSSRTDFNNNQTTYVNDLTRNLETSRTEAAGTAKTRTTVTAWHPTFRVPTSIIEANRTTSFTHDANGNVLTRTVTDTSVTPSVSRTWTYTYNAFGRVLTEDGPRTDVSDVTTYTYYTCTTGAECGQLHTVTNALGHVTTYNSYNANSQATQITDPNGLVTSLAYDLRQRLTDRCVGGTLPSCAGGELTHLDYWPTGLLKKVTNPDASYIQYTYDNAHRLTQINDGASNKIVYTLDAMGNRTAEISYDPGNSLRRTHSRVFNTLNQLWKDVNAAGTAAVTTTFGYDSNNNRTSVAAPLARNSSSLYDELNRLKQITDPASGITQFGYDANDNLTSVTDPRSLVTSYAYSGFGDLTTQTSPDTGVTTNTYDAAGNLDTSTDSRGAVSHYGYDAANRVTSVSFTLGGVTDQTITYGYDAGPNQNGRLTSASDANHTLTWTYDSHGRVTGKGQTVGGVTLTMGYSYDSSGRLGTVQLPSGNIVALRYNVNGQVTSITLNGSTTILSNITYDPFGPITSWTWGNGTTASRGFDTDGKITQVDNANGQSLKNYGYDDAFRITSVTDALDSSQSWSYVYDSLDRLSSASKTGFTQGWTYDANGNRLSETGSTPSTYTNSGASNRLSSTSGSLVRSYSYDNAGNTLSFAGATFTYNNRGRMASATNGGVTANYTYNALGQRIRRATASVTSLYVYDEAGHLAGEYTSTGSLVQETVWFGDIPVATVRPNGAGGVNFYYVHTDNLNTPRLVTDTANSIHWRWDSDAFGTTPPNQNPSGLGTFEYSLRFPGQQYDAVVGLHYNYYRDLDPATGRYVESDPIGLAGGGANTYAYAGENPLLVTDQYGLLPGGFGPSAGAAMDALIKRHNGPPEVDPDVKELLCKFIRKCAGNWDCVYNDLNVERRGNRPKGEPPNPTTWNNPLLRNAENFAAAAAPDSGIGSSGIAHSAVGVIGYQYGIKSLRKGAGLGSTDYSLDAVSNGISGTYWWRNRDPSEALKWCDGCEK